MNREPGRLEVVLRQQAPTPLDLAFSCEPGQVLAIFGPSGSGKTTTLRQIAGLGRPESGRVVCGGETWLDTTAGVHRRPHERPVGFVFQEYALFPHLSALGNIMAAMGQRPARARVAEARRLLALVHLDALADRRPAALSGGERQRVALARALAREPRVLLLDEPFAASDRALRRSLHAQVDAVRRLWHIPLILVTHDFADCVRLASHVLLIERGRAIVQGAVEEVTSRPDLEWLNEAVGLGSVFDATVAETDRGRGLVTLAFAGGTLIAAEHGLARGSRVRVRVPAREVILAAQVPVGLSVHNILAGTVVAMHGLSAPALHATASARAPATTPAPEATARLTDTVAVRLRVGEIHVLAEVTRDAVARLRIAPGATIHALIKSVSIELGSIDDSGADTLSEGLEQHRREGVHLPERG